MSPKECCKWVVFTGCVSAILYATFGLGYGIQIVRADDSGWMRSPSNPVQSIPVEQQGASLEELEDFDTVKVLHKYKVTANTYGVAYHDKTTNMDCHVIYTATLLDPRGITCERSLRKAK